MSEQALTPVQKNIAIPLAALYPHDRNFREHPAEQIKMLKSSLERFGQVRSVVATPNDDGSYTIVAGHGVVKAAQELVDRNPEYAERFGKIRCDIIDASWPAEQIAGYLAADNLLSHHAQDDEELLAQLLQEQHDAGYDLATLGSDEFALKDMLAKMTPPTLDELTQEYGDEPEDDAFWPVIRVKVSPETKELYDSLMEDVEGTDEGAKFAWLLERVNMADEGEDDET